MLWNSGNLDEVFLFCCKICWFITLETSCWTMKMLLNNNYCNKTHVFVVCSLGKKNDIFGQNLWSYLQSWTFNCCLEYGLRNFSSSLLTTKHSSRYSTSFNQKVLMFFIFLHKNICCGTHLKCLTEALLMSTHNICFHGEIRKHGYPSHLKLRLTTPVHCSVTSRGDLQGHMDTEDLDKPSIARDKALFFNEKALTFFFFLFLHRNICYGYLLEASQCAILIITENMAWIL